MLFTAGLRRKAGSIVAATLVSFGLAVAVPAPAVATPPSAAATTLAWTPCRDGFYCATLKVPLDYDHPHGPQISLAMVKLPAGDPAHRIGSLFLNPGGPGGSGVDFVRQAGRILLTPAVRARFDLVGFDPRGIGRSTPLLCFDNEGQAGRAFLPFPYPNNAAETRRWFANDRYQQQHCADQGGRIKNHMATADVARDLDSMRAAVGDQSLNYYGVSYGSFLGDTYANLFPGNVRSLVIDGVLDPIAWTTGRDHESRTLPFSTRLHSAAGAQATLQQFFRLCDAGGPSRCAFAPNAGGRFMTLYHRLSRHPLLVPNPGGPSLHYDETFLIGDTLGAMYDSSSWADLAQYLAMLERAAAPAVLRSGLAALHHAAVFTQYPNYVEGFPGVACSDSVNPTSPRAWIAAARTAARQDGLFGPIWTWITSVCSQWPGHDADRYLGPFTHRTANPVLVVGNLYDPATPYAGARTAARLLPNSRLLTVHGWGHTSLFLSACADQAIGHYLLTSQPPAPGTVCQQDVVPFTGTAPSPVPDAARRTLDGWTHRWE